MSFAVILGLANRAGPKLTLPRSSSSQRVQGGGGGRGGRRRRAKENEDTADVTGNRELFSVQCAENIHVENHIPLPLPHWMSGMA